MADVTFCHTRLTRQIHPRTRSSTGMPLICQINVIFVDFEGLEAHQFSIWLTLEAWRSSWLGLGWLDGSWLAGCWLAGCWLAGLGPQDLRAYAHLRVTPLSRGVSRNQKGGTYNTLPGRKEDYKTARLEGLQGCQLARLEDWKGFKAVNLERHPPQPGGP